MLKKNHAIALCALLCSTNLLAQKRVAGMNLSPASYGNIHVKPKTEPTKNQITIETAVSLKQWFPPVRDQKETHTCLVNAMTSAFAAQEARRLERTNEADKQKLMYSVGYLYRSIMPRASSCDVPLSLNDMERGLREAGIVRDNVLPVICASKIESTASEQANKNILEAFHILFEQANAENATLLVKEALSKKNPVVIGLQGYDESFGNLKSKSGEDCLWAPSPNAQGAYKCMTGATPCVGHAICVVGYDDEKFGGTEGGFEILNSYGEKWGNKGYAWISYRDFVKFTSAAVEVLPFCVPDIVNIPQPSQPTKATEPVAETFNTKIILKRVGGKDLSIAKTGAVLGKPTMGSNPKGKLGNQNVQTLYESYRVTEPMKEGERYRIYLENQEHAYVYVFNVDMSNNFDLLFPHQKANESPYIDKQRSVILPSKSTAIQLGDVKGTDYLCILLSNTALDINLLKQELLKDKSAFYDRLVPAVESVTAPPTALGNSNLKSSGAKPNTNAPKASGKQEKTVPKMGDPIKYIETQLKMNGGQKTLIPIIIEFDHQ